MSNYQQLQKQYFYFLFDSYNIHEISILSISDQTIKVLHLHGNILCTDSTLINDKIYLYNLNNIITIIIILTIKVCITTNLSKHVAKFDVINILENLNLK